MAEQLTFDAPESTSSPAAAQRRTPRRKPAPRARTVQRATALGLAPPGSPEWHVAWKGLVDLTGDEDQMALDDASGEVWQYMGTALFGKAWLHEFRHRWHPRLRQRWLVRVPASKGWVPDDVF